MPDEKQFLVDRYGADNIKYIGRGSDSAAYCVNDYVFRFTSKNKAIYQREADICRFLAQYINCVEIPVIDVVDNGDLFYAQHKMLQGKKWSWHSFSWLPWRQQRLACTLAQFMAQLHSADVNAARAAVNDIDIIADEYVDFDDVVPVLSKFLGPRMIKFFRRNYDRVLKQPVADSDMVLVHMGIKGANSVCYPDGRLKGVYDFGNCGIYERSRDFVLLGLSRNRRLYNAVVRHYKKLTGITIDRRRVMDLASIEFMWKKRWMKDGRIQQVKRDYFIRKQLAWVIVNFSGLPRVFFWRALVTWMGIYAYVKRHCSGK